MKKKFSLLIALVMAISLCLTPAVAVAEDVGVGGTVYSNVLILENKDSSWQPIVDEIGGILGYNAIGSEFEWALEATVLQPSTSYSLIYYADKPDRFVDWGGDNPGALIGTAVSDGQGVIMASGVIDLGMDLPCPPDANQFEIDYSEPPDSYANAHGAKIWLVPTSYLPTAWPNDGGWMTWSADVVSNILFETDLIWYDDTDVDSYAIAISVGPTTVDFGILSPGYESTGSTITVTNECLLPVTVEVTLPSDVLFSLIKFDGGIYGSRDIPVGESNSAVPTLTAPAGLASGEYTGVIVFWASGPQ